MMKVFPSAVDVAAQGDFCGTQTMGATMRQAEYIDVTALADIRTAQVILAKVFLLKDRKNEQKIGAIRSELNAIADAVAKRIQTVD